MTRVKGVTQHDNCFKLDAIETNFLLNIRS